MSGALEIIDKARELLAEEHNWAPNGVGSAIYSTSEGSRCPLVALIHAHNLTKTSTAAWSEACRAVRAQLPDSFDPDGQRGKFIGIWNDTPGRTHAEVLAALDRAREALAHG